MKNVPALIEYMSAFASNTPNDKLSVMVARVVNRLVHQESLFENPLTEDELRIIRTFEAKMSGKLDSRP